MTKKQKILAFLVVIPLVAAYVYDRLFRYSGNWLETNQSYFIFGFALISLFGIGWLIKMTYTEKSLLGRFLLILEIILFLGLLGYIYVGLAFINLGF